MFDIEGKVALVTGGASGIGLEIVKELFRNGLQACTIADSNDTLGKEVVESINKEFGLNKVIFVNTDVVEKTQFEAAYKATVKEFGNIDILVNNAGILDELRWGREIDVNLKGVVNGFVLGLEDYLQKYRTGSDSVIMTTASVTGIDPFISIPIYTATKYAVIGLVRAFGAKQHYDRTKVKVLAICPGITNTMLLPFDRAPVDKALSAEYGSLFSVDIEGLILQRPENVAKAATHIIKYGKPGSIWVSKNEERPYELDFPTRKERKKDL